MLEYMRAKVADYAILLSWIEQELRDIELRHPEHHPLSAVFETCFPVPSTIAHHYLAMKSLKI